MSATTETARRLPRPAGRARLHIALALAMLTASVCLNVLLARKVAQLRNNIAALKAEGQLQAGDPAPPIEAADVAGKPASISYGEGDAPTVLYVFSPQCGWCTRNLSNIKALAEGARGRYRFIALSLSDRDFKDYVSRHDFGFPTYAGISEETRAAYKLGGTPQTIVVSKDGRVQKSWTGAYSGDVQEQVEAFFGASLPGLLPAAGNR